MRHLSNNGAPLTANSSLGDQSLSLSYALVYRYVNFEQVPFTIQPCSNNAYQLNFNTRNNLAAISAKKDTSQYYDEADGSYTHHQYEIKPLNRSTQPIFLRARLQPIP